MAGCALQPGGGRAAGEWTLVDHPGDSRARGLKVGRKIPAFAISGVVCSRQTSEPLQAGFPSSLSRRDVVYYAQHPHRRASVQPPGGLTDVRSPPGSGGPRGPAPSLLEAGLEVRQIRVRGAPRTRSQAEGISDSSRQGAAPALSRAAMPVGPASCFARRAPRPPSGEGRHSPRRAHCDPTPRFPPNLASPSDLGPGHKAVPLPPHHSPGRALPVRSRPPSSAHSRTPVSQQLTMVSATRPVRPVPALPAGDLSSRRILSSCSPLPPALRSGSAPRAPLSAAPARKTATCRVILAAPRPWPLRFSPEDCSEPPPPPPPPGKSREECPAGALRDSSGPRRGAAEGGGHL